MSNSDKTFAVSLAKEIQHILYYIAQSACIEAASKNVKKMSIEYIKPSRISGPVILILKQSRTYRSIEKGDYKNVNSECMSQGQDENILRLFYPSIRGLINAFGSTCVERTSNNMIPMQYRNFMCPIVFLRAISRILVEIIMAGNAGTKEKIKYKPSHVTGEWYAACGLISYSNMYRILDILNT